MTISIIFNNVIYLGASHLYVRTRSLLIPKFRQLFLIFKAKTYTLVFLQQSMIKAHLLLS